MTPGPAKQFDRDEVLERAMRVFWEQGYEATGMTQLLSAMGIGRQSLYDTFGDKRLLYLETLNHFVRSRISPILAILDADGSPMANIGKFFETMGQEMEADNFCGCLIGNCSAEVAKRDDEVSERAKIFFSRVEDAFAKTLTRAQGVGEISPTADPRALAQLLIHTAQGVALLSRVTQDRERARGVMETALKLVQSAR